MVATKQRTSELSDQGQSYSRTCEFTKKTRNLRVIRHQKTNSNAIRTGMTRFVEWTRVQSNGGEWINRMTIAIDDLKTGEQRQ